MNVNTSLSNAYWNYTHFSASGVSVKGDDKAGAFTAFNFEVSSFEFKFQNSSFALSNAFTLPPNLSDYIDYDAIGYTGKPIEKLTKDEAAELVSDEGFFGVAKTAERLAGFVINGSGDDLERLQEGRKGIIQGFEEAEAIWGKKLFDISYETLDKALASIDERIAELGGNVLDLEV